ncbi:MAG: hypothetical protein ACXW37_08805 [Nitrospira sp.]
MESDLRQHHDPRRTTRLCRARRVEQAHRAILALSTASFLYIGLADLIPGLPRRIGSEAGIAQLLLLLAGVGTIVVLRLPHG